MTSDQKIVLAFDAYGTLLSTESIAKKLASHFGQDTAQKIAATWRSYQLQYTWRLNSMNQYQDFSKVTLHSLKHALSESNVTLKDSEIADLMKAYDSLSTFPDVVPALHSISSSPNLHAVVFSNGTNAMVSTSVHKSPDLAPISHVFKDIVVVEEVKRFKPDPETYFHLAKTVGKDPKSEKDMGSMWLISGNPFDIVGARAVGMKALWVDRAGGGWCDSVVEGEVGRPTAIVKSLEEVVDIVKSTK